MRTEISQWAYGLNFRGLPPLPEIPAAPLSGRDDQAVTVRVDSTSALPPDLRPLDRDRGVRLLADGHVLALDRRQATATFYGDPVPAELMAHPYLAPVATTFNRWAGREAFHAGAFVVDGRAWAVLGHRTAGKSTLLAALAARGIDVLSDDIVVTDATAVFRGPRCIDLRDPLPGGDLRLEPARLGTRWRVRLPEGPESAPLGGWFFLSWGDAPPAGHPVPARELIGRLAARRACGALASDPARLLTLAGLPAWDLARPRDWEALDPTLDLVTRLAAAGRVDALLDAPTSAASVS